MSQTTTPKQIPPDILQVDSFLRDFRADLTDVMMMESTNGPQPYEMTCEHGKRATDRNLAGRVSEIG